MNDTPDLSEGYVLAVQVRTDALKAAVDVATSSGFVIMADATDVVTDMAKVFERYINTGGV